MPQNPEHIEPVDWEAVRRNLAETLAEAEDMAADFAAEMRAEAQRLSEETKEG